MPEDISPPRVRQNALSGRRGAYLPCFLSSVGNSHLITTFCVRSEQMCNCGKWNVNFLLRSPAVKCLSYVQWIFLNGRCRGCSKISNMPGTSSDISDRRPYRAHSEATGRLTIAVTMVHSEGNLQESKCWELTWVLPLPLISLSSLRLTCNFY